MRWAGYVESTVRRGLKKPIRKETVGRHRRRWEDNIVTDLINALPGRGFLYLARCN
jgi:hypothetical protein